MCYRPIKRVVTLPAFPCPVKCAALLNAIQIALELSLMVQAAHRATCLGSIRFSSVSTGYELSCSQAVTTDRKGAGMGAATMYVKDRL